MEMLAASVLLEIIVARIKTPKKLAAAAGPKPVFLATVRGTA
jgi:hypothetical protein